MGLYLEICRPISFDSIKSRCPCFALSPLSSLGDLLIADQEDVFNLFHDDRKGQLTRFPNTHATGNGFGLGDSYTL
jgi:hypothetical protein